MVDSIPLTPVIQRMIATYATALRMRKIPFDRIVVFGSHARGTSTKNSDIDVCVVSPSFGADYHQALVSLLSAAIDIEGDLDVVPYTPTDLADRYDPLASEIRTYGQSVV